MVAQCRVSVADGGPVASQFWDNMTCLLGKCVVRMHERTSGDRPTHIYNVISSIQKYLFLLFITLTMTDGVRHFVDVAVFLLPGVDVYRAVIVIATTFVCFSEISEIFIIHRLVTMTTPIGARENNVLFLHLET